MTALTEQFSLEDITARAQAVPFWRTVFRLVTFIPFLAGWLAAKACAIGWLALAWVWMSLCEGWEAAHGPSRGKQIAALSAQVEELKTQLGRFSG